MKRKLALVILFPLAAASLLTMWLVLRNSEPNPAINVENYRKIRIGKTEKEALEIMASPPGHYATNPIILDSHDEDISTPPTPPKRVISWMGNECGIVLWLDENNIVAEKGS